MPVVVHSPQSPRTSLLAIAGQEPRHQFLNILLDSRETRGFGSRAERSNKAAIMEDQEYRVLSETQKQIKSEAFKRSLFRPLISPSSKAARFPGFHQGVRTYKAGQQVEKGALPLPIDIVLHESVSMVLDDGTKLYTDIFLPSRFQSLDAVAERRVPALVVW